MIKKKIFLCMLLSLGAVSSFSSFEKREQTIEQNIQGASIGKVGLFNKPINDRPVFMDCPHCGYPTAVYKNDSVHYCEHCGMDINASVESMKEVACPWCNFSNKMRESVNPAGVICGRCNNFLTEYTSISFCAKYSYKTKTSTLAGNKVELYQGKNSDSGKLISTDYTNDLGRVLFTIPKSSVSDIYARDYFVRIYPADDNIKIYFDSKWDLKTETYQKEAVWKKSNSETYPCYETRNNVFLYGRENPFDINVALNDTDPFASENAFSYCFYIGQCVLRAQEYTATKMKEIYGDKKPKKVTVGYDFDADTSHYNNLTGEITLKPGEFYCGLDTIMHEYGHHVQRQLGSNSIFAFASHSYLTRSNKITAWSEAWAEVFPEVVQDNTPYYRKTLSIGTLCKYGDKKYKNHPLEGNDEHGREWVESQGFGESVVDSAKKIEGVIAELLWDLYDVGEPTFSNCTDEIYLGGNWFKATTYLEPDDIDDLYDSLMQFIPKRKSEVNQMFYSRGLI